MKIPRIIKSVYNQPKIDTSISMQFLIALVSMFIGGLIYLKYRVETLLMFTWIEHLGMLKAIQLLRNKMTFTVNSIPDWVVYSLPNALWLFSGLLLFNVIWGKKPSLHKILWLLFFSSIALGSEIAQYFNFIPGIYDPIDLLTLVIAIIFAVIIIPNDQLKTSKNEKRNS